MKKNKFFFEVSKKNSNSRIDIFLNNQIQDLSRSQIKKLIKSKNVKINNNIIFSTSKIVKECDNVEILFKEEKEEKILANKVEFKIIYQDKDLIIVDKPSGLTVHPGAGNKNNTMVNGLLYLYKNNLSNISGTSRPGIIHRIDKDTSGLLVVAKNNLSHSILSEQFSKHNITRKYTALIWGKLKPRSGKIKTLITRSKKNRQMMEVGINKGKEAITNYKTLEIFENDKAPTFSLIECKLETGRTHQIRVHMSYKGNNILGDKKYKKRFKEIKNIDNELAKSIKSLNRQFLHAETLGFKHPISGKYLEFQSGLPRNLVSILKKLRKTNNK